ncbi:hypothetical protein BDQ94DRAFT_76404 [Aspergillus welwitschiae]|uniref:Uncharacterized protein n=1 Tax=Aspergillus welwitschiae TaxID=1341132 RepID=A0A3F3PVR4_9EURO|nr:hypothetical protein BDQ94DRAFT_76404 [Aspergillus welwitschiae]RDH30436.1 hypothetical protein BDQ94DRAFT_76404 [Aspergillus welwitschiae]
MRISESSGYKPSLPDQASVTKLFFPSLTSHPNVTRRDAWTGSVKCTTQSPRTGCHTWIPRLFITRCSHVQGVRCATRTDPNRINPELRWGLDRREILVQVRGAESPDLSPWIGGWQGSRAGPSGVVCLLVSPRHNVREDRSHFAHRHTFYPSEHRQVGR